LSKVNAAKKLIQLRGEKTREVVANAVGVSISALQMYENAQRMPKDDIKVRLANYYEVSVQDLFFEDQLHESCRNISTA
jgi:putative transcriptional regulator